MITKLLIECTVKMFIGKGNRGLFTGFFIAPRVILTCYHAFRNKDIDTVNINWKGNEYIGVLNKELSSPSLDFAIVDVDITDHPCVYINEKTDIHDKLYTYGYHPDYPNGDSTTLEMEGTTVKADNSILFKLKGGNIIPGLSGSPILNLETGGVCSLLRTTRNKYLALGGRAVPIHLISSVGSLKEKNNDWNKKNLEWTESRQQFKEGIGLFDHTFYKSHDCIFDDSFKIKDIWVEPKYKIFKFENLQGSQETCSGIIEDSLSVLAKENLLFIIGAYGSGKTVFLKQLQMELINKGEDTCYIEFKDITNYSQKDFVDLVSSRKQKSSDFYLFIDGYSEINFMNKNKIDLIDSTLKNVILVSKIDAVKIIISSRNIPHKEEDIFELLDYEVTNICGTTSTYIINLEYFGKPQVENWLDAYSNEMAKKGQEERIYPDVLKRTHKHLNIAARNPLFLYMTVHCYYTRGIDSINDIYSVYDSFVDSTVHGKFNSTVEAIREISNEYREFLMALAIKIATSKSVSNDKSQNYHSYLDDNIIKYSISEKEIANIVDDTAKKILMKSKRKMIDSQRLYENILSCYFLEKYDHSWHFKDNNLVFFFVASQLFEKFNKADLAYKETGDITKSVEIILDIYDLPIHPMTLEFLFFKLESLDNDRKKSLQAMLRNAIENELIFQISALSFHSIDARYIRSSLLLALVFIRLNVGGEYYKIEYFFKRLFWYINAAKQSNRMNLYVVRRFFRKITVKQIEFRRLNFDDYDFSESTYSDVNFIQSKFYDTHMVDMKFDDVTFNLCELRDVNMSDSSGKLSFKNCYIDKLTITPSDIIDLTFIRCFIKEIKIDSSDSLKKYDIEIKILGGEIEKFTFKNSLSEKFIMDYVVFNSLHVEGSIIHHRILNSNCKSKPVKDFITNSKSKIREFIS